MRAVGLGCFIFLAALLISGMGNAFKNVDSNSSLAAELSYKDNSTASAYINVLVKDSKTGDEKKLVLENLDFMAFFSWEKGGGLNDSTLRFEYVAYMLANRNKAINIDLEKYVAFLASRRFGSTEAAAKYLDDHTYYKNIAIEDLGFDKKELLERYFNKGRQENFWVLKPNIKNNGVNPYGPEFIAMLIDLGFVVRRGDIAPVLIISVPEMEAQ
jgi:hypothetical protein